ncbi:hypothetical protein [Laspinema olomoucense]|nr:hypothetical protein [Laspinema sp. D3c]
MSKILLFLWYVKIYRNLERCCREDREAIASVVVEWGERLKSLLRT